VNLICSRLQGQLTSASIRIFASPNGIQLPRRFSNASVHRGFSSNTMTIGRARLPRSGTCQTTRWWSSDQHQAEAPQDLIRRIKEANRFMPLERLALSPQCGFASSIFGNELSIEDERRKLERVCEAARRIWT
jgi:hypothetical protein